MSTHYFIISEDRACELLDQINTAKMPGVYDWFVEEQMLYIFFSVSGVQYVYRTITIDNGKDLPPKLILALKGKQQVLGVFEIESEEKVAEKASTTPVTLEDVFGVK